MRPPTTADGSGNPQAISETCATLEYGDPFDVMGNGLNSSSSSLSGGLHNRNKGLLGILPIADTVTVTSAGTATYTLSPSEQVLPGELQLLRVPRNIEHGQVVDYYYLDFRQPFGTFDNFEADAPVVNGVTIRIAVDYPGFGWSFLIDTRPSTFGGYWDAPLATGQTFNDPWAGVSITTLGVSSEGATIQITLAHDSPPTSTRTPTPTSTAPAATPTPTYTPTDTPTPTYTPTDTPTAADTPTRTPTPPNTPTHTPRPTRTPTPTRARTPAGGARGDATCDGVANSLDSLYILQFYAALLHALPCPQNADVNRDGVIDAVDSLLILQYDAGLIHSLPA